MEPPTDQRFYRGSNRLIAGVCSGLAEGFHVDPMWVRLAFVLLAVLQGIGVLLYIVLWLVMPERAAAQVGGRSGLDSMGDDLKRAWAELKAQFSGSPTTTSPAAPPTPAPVASPPPPTPQVAVPVTAPPAAATSAAPVTTTSPNAALLLGLALLVIGVAVLANNLGFADWQLAWPAALIALGIFLLVRAMGRKA